MDYYPQSKIYHDGSHYIGIPHTTNPTKRRKKPPEELVEVVDEENAENTAVTDPPNGEVTADFADEKDSVSSTTQPSDTKSVSNTILPVNTKESKSQKPKKQATRSQIFKVLYSQSKDMTKAERRKFLLHKMRKYFKDSDTTKDFVATKLECERTNEYNRLKRFRRKAYMNDFNFFVTFTYDSSKHEEAAFKKKLMRCLANYHTRYGWKYMGVWERSPKAKRLHLHAIVFVPDGTMPGKLVTVNDFSFETHTRQETVQNTFFNDRFGRTDFKELNPIEMKNGNALAYITKYINKTNEKIVYSRDTPMYVITDVMAVDVACRTGEDDDKLVLFDNFTCWDEGCLVGEIDDPKTKAQLRTSNT
ncbi:MAG: hypothetical protein RSB09_03460 [Clostridia bacterium]